MRSKRVAEVEGVLACNTPLFQRTTIYFPWFSTRALKGLY